MEIPPPEINVRRLAGDCRQIIGPPASGHAGPFHRPHVAVTEGVETEHAVAALPQLEAAVFAVKGVALFELKGGVP